MKTIEEAAADFTKSGEINPDDLFQTIIQEAFTFGANWQKEQDIELIKSSQSQVETVLKLNEDLIGITAKMYTEKEVKQLLEKLLLSKEHGLNCGFTMMGLCVISK